MPSFVKFPTEILKRDAEQAQRLVQGVGHAKTLALLGRAQKELDARLKRAEGLGGPGKESFTAAQLRATLAQVRAVTTRLGVGMQGVVLEQGKQAAEHAATNATKYLAAAERHFTGSTERLNLDTARIVDRAVAGTESSVLQRLLHGPDPKKREGILQRYGQNVVNHFEDRLQQRVIQRTPWAEVRDQLVEDSPFLQAAPAHWAERIVRTETMAQEGRASLVTIQSADEQLGDACKIISSTFDSRTGADSFAVHGQIRRPNEAFESWFGSYAAPPDRPNDRSIVVPHRVSWPIPDSLKPKSDGAVSARWSAEGRKGSPPGRPRMTTIPLDQFGKRAPPKPADPSTENPGSPQPPPAPTNPLERRLPRAGVQVQNPAALRGRWPAELPDEPAPPEPLNVLHRRIAPASGSNPGGVFEGSDGIQRYVKFYKDSAQAFGEHLANLLYSDLGLGGVNSQTFAHEGGVAYASEMLPDTKQLGSVLTPKLAKKALEGFAADVLTANWDAAGMNLDNMLVGKGGAITRIDNGGSFLNRAQGARKPGHLLNDPTEWSSFFDPKKNAAYARLAAEAGVSGPQDLAASLKKGVKQILQVRDAAGGWAKYVAEHAEGLAVSDKQSIVSMLDARTDFLTDRVAELAKPRTRKVGLAKAPPITQDEINETKELHREKRHEAGHFLRMQPELDVLHDYTGGGYSTMNRVLNPKTAAHYTTNDLKEYRAKGARLQSLLTRAVDAGSASPGVVYRGLKHLDVESLNLFSTESKLTFPSFTSTSIAEEKALAGFAGTDPSRSVMLRIRQHTGVPVMLVSAVQHEQEVLIQAGTSYRVLKREIKDGRLWLDLQQLPVKPSRRPL